MFMKGRRRLHRGRRRKERIQMKHAPVAFFLAVFLLCFWDPAAGGPRRDGGERQEGTRIALDLMDLDIPGEGGGNEVQLPPIQGTDKSEPEPAPQAPPEKPQGLERSRNETQPAGRPVSSSGSGMVPFLLDEPGAGGGKSRAEGRRPEAPLDDEFGAELKAVPPPPSNAESLKLPSGMGASASGGSDVPEIPLLKDEDRGRQGPATPGRDASLTMKPFPDLSGPSNAGRAARSSARDLRPEDTLQVHEDIDSQLIDLFERYYKDR